MRRFILSGIALAALAQPAFADAPQEVGAPLVVDAIPLTPPDYVRPAYGYRLPQKFMTAEYYIANPREYRLRRPAPGFGWSRYHDDAVLTDQWGRVYDVRYGVDRDRKGRWGQSRHDGEAAAAGIGGAAVGAVAGNLIAGTGSRLAGSLIGGGVGALAGLAIEAATAKHRREHRDGRYGDDYDGPHWRSDYGYDDGGEIVTTTVRRTSGDCGCQQPRELVTYENVYAPVARALPVSTKARRTTSPRPRVRGDY